MARFTAAPFGDQFVGDVEIVRDLFFRWCGHACLSPVRTAGVYRLRATILPSPPGSCAAREEKGP